MIYNTGIEAMISGLSAVLIAQVAKLFVFICFIEQALTFDE